MAVGLSVAANAWINPRGALELRDRAVDVVEVADEMIDGLLEEAQDSLLDLAQIVPTPEPLKPIMRTVAQGDTIKGIAEEYSVSINTILASNKIEDPD
ncbi:MAG: LysM peptidoglycan-binding domain-containing protein, partial [Chloroflexi bacterium]|nr:LysM peptidoglycan-binding domain-containing protein [Chloroflexota bacterium]